jgi:hypothetical protein
MLWQEAPMMRACKEPKLDDLLSDPILDKLLAHDRVSRDDLDRVVETARRTLARIPRQWHKAEEMPVDPVLTMVKAEARDYAVCCSG